MATQVKFGTPNTDFAVIDNSAAPTFPTLSANTSLGYDTTTPGSQSQGVNVYADTGSAGLMDSVNDTVTPDASVATVAGNPVSNTQPTYKTVSIAVQNATSGIFCKWKNPAVWFLACLLIRHLI